MEIDVPRDRNGAFEPQLVKKHQTDVSALEDKAMFLYSQGLSTRNIQRPLQNVSAIHTVYPNTEVQRCVVHQIRASTWYVPYKDLKAFAADLKPVYTAPTEESALAPWTSRRPNGAQNTL